MNLLCLAPDIQEEILFLSLTERGRDAVTEKHLRPIAGIPGLDKAATDVAGADVFLTPPGCYGSENQILKCIGVADRLQFGRIAKSRRMVQPRADGSPR